MTRGRAALWALMALLGIVLAAALTWSVMRLAGQHIGLSSAPVAAVRGLAPSAPARRAAPEPDAVTVTRTVTIERTVPGASVPGATVPGATVPGATVPSAGGGSSTRALTSTPPSTTTPLRTGTGRVRTPATATHGGRREDSGDGRGGAGSGSPRDD